MTLAEINWKQFLGPGSEQPPDVFFSIPEEDKSSEKDRPSAEVSKLDGATGVFTFGANEVLEDAAKDSSVFPVATLSPPDQAGSTSNVTTGSKFTFTRTVVSAHKFLLAGASPVFRRQFLGSLRDTSAVVLIKDTTFEAFDTMINYLYNPPGNSFSLSHLKCPQDLCEIYNIAERYQLEKLKLIVYAVLTALPINSENLLFAAATAKRWYVFPNVSKMLLEKCTIFLAEKMKTAEDVFKLMLLTKENFPDADPDLLQELLRMNAEKPKSCSNCKRGLAHCVHGQNVTGLEEPPVLAKGVRVRSSSYRGVVTVQSLHHRKTSRSNGFQLNTSEEVEKFPKTGDPTCFSVKTNPSNISMEEIATTNQQGGFTYRLSYECK